MPKSFYITTPIFYPNDRLHLGHAYVMVLADIVARYKKSQGYRVYFQTGSDEHGEKIEKKADLLGISPQGLVDKNILLFQQLWRELGVFEHIFYRTSSLAHKEKVQKIFTELLNKGDIYLGEYQGKYCIACEDYVRDSKVVDNNLCPTPNCQAELRKINEPAYFLRVSKYYSELIKYYSQNPDFLSPPNIKKELFKNFLKNDIRDLCITRREKFFLSELSDEKKINNAKEVACVVIQNKNNEYLLVYNKKYQHWQFPGGKLEPGENAVEAAKREIFEETNLVVEDLEKIGKLLIKEKETIGEIKFLKISEIQEINNQDRDKITKYLLEKLTNKEPNNNEIIHLIGKEITRKMSKSKGNVIDPLELLEKYPPDLLRIYFIAKINFLQDGVCAEDLLRDFYHDFLVNNLSNLVSRVNKMLHLYNEGIVPEIKQEQVVKNKKLEEY
ncbi:4993_t:CDS:2 [Entrophospora sp. SA101]|nr:4993_t:CDS:2 [Entrophospora sp. SA101]